MRCPRIYPILDTQSLAANACEPETAARAWLDGGARILQFRHKGQWTRSVFEQAERVAGQCRERRAIFVINDRADVALLLGAGLHVGQDDLAPGDARKLMGAEALLGYSTHNPHQLDTAAAEPVDYAAIGPIFGTASKQNPDPVVGLDELRRCRARCVRPLVAIGGITRETARAVFAAGADAVAVIGDLIPENCTSAELRRRMEEWQQLAQT
ncbi:MAG TPA: thiamine phosphate synthase [Bryobacteraceae bacterium]|jgi:thiamine-phosphate pyrophosphorylase|nr:thiamine phosphate synthase [Bryobacteraceae bacterium]